MTGCLVIVDRHARDEPRGRIQPHRFGKHGSRKGKMRHIAGLRATIRVNGRDHVRKGETVYVTTDPHNVHVFDTESGARLSD